MISLVQINTTANYSATGRIAENIGLLAVERGWESFLVHGPRYINASNLQTICTESSLGEKIHGIKSLLLDEHGLGSTIATKKLIKKLETISPSIIHLHNIHGYYINYPILFEYLAKINIPIVWTLHDCWSMTGHCTHFDFIKCEKWKTHCQTCPQLKQYPKSIFIDNSYKNYELKKHCFLKVKNKLHLVSVSHWLENIIHHSFFKDCDTRTIYNGVDLDLFTPRKTSLKKNNLKFNIVGVANVWTKRKGLEDFIKLRHLLPKENFDITLVGITKNIASSIPNGINLIERTNNITQLADLYSAADVFFNPTWEDSFPTTNIEALACGTPVITYRTGGSPEAVSTDTGFVIEKGNLKEVVKAINTIREKGKNSYTQQCRKRAENNFDKNCTYMQYIDLYNTLLH